ncbi:MAG TPA: hypothetical protein DDW41_05270 [Candidatus Andersenbacteria bacterium]|nr:MAG: hypothetical protein UW94_C0010G0026 [Parcubacteria group bacterium GW2011_GWA2_45_14]HBE90592.1 hypothetical protein [Candidatus Andersenbacteria bacterium]
MSTNPFSVDVVISGQAKKLFEQLSGLTTEQAQELLEGGYFTALRDAKRAGILPPIGQVRDFLMGRRTLAIVATPNWKVWKTIRIGTGIKNGKGFCSELEKDDCRMGSQDRAMLGQKVFTVATEETKVDLVRLSVADLGFKECARYDAICARAIEMGLELCPAEVGPQLRWQYPDQPLGEWLVIAMEAICDSDGNLRVFLVWHNDAGLWLHSEHGWLGSLWFPDDRFVFRARKRSRAA